MPKISDERRAAIIAAILESLEMGSTLSDSCGAAGINPYTFRKWRHADEELEKSVQDRLLAQIDVVVGALFKNCLKGKEASIFFFLCNRDPGRWQHRNQTEHSGSVDLSMAFRDISEERLRQILEGLGGAGDAAGDAESWPRR